MRQVAGAFREVRAAVRDFRRKPAQFERHFRGEMADLRAAAFGEERRLLFEGFRRFFCEKQVDFGDRYGVQVGATRRPFVRRSAAQMRRLGFRGEESKAEE